MIRLKSPKVLLYLRVFLVDLLYMSAGCVMSWPSPLVGRLHYTRSEISWVGSLMSLGATLGPAFQSFFITRLPRKAILYGCGCCFLLSWAILATTSYFPVVCVGRIVGGAAVGTSFISIPIYLTEISDVQERQAVTTFVDFFLGIGFLLVYFSGPVLNYRLIQGLCASLTLLFLLAFYSLPETPVFLAGKGETGKALQVLEDLRQSKQTAQAELVEIQKYVSERKDGETGLLKMLRRPGHTKALLLSLMIMALQQTSGITVFISFIEPIMAKLRIPLSPSMAAVVFGASNLPCLVISPLMARSLGAKLSVIITSAIMAVSMVVFTVYTELDRRGYEVEKCSFIPLLALTIYNVSFCSGVGPLSWTIIAEISPAALKGFICFIATAVCYLTSFIYVRSFHTVSEAFGLTVVFGAFSLSLLFGTFILNMALPNTRGLTFQQIQEIITGISSPDSDKGQTDP